MERRKFMQQSLLASGALLASSASVFAKNNDENVTIAEKPFHLNYGIHDGMFQNHAGKDFIDQIKFAYDNGFRGIEDNGMSGRPEDQQKKIGDTLAKLGMGMGVFVQPDLGNDSNMLASGKADQVEKFVASCKKAVEIAKRINSKLVTVVPGDFVRDLPIGVQTGNVIEAVKKGTAILEPHGIIMVLEPLSDITEDGCWESCLSVPGMRGLVPRHTHLHYSGFDQHGTHFECEVHGLHARVVQHECDHLNGILYQMRIKNMRKFGFQKELFGNESDVKLS